MSENIGIGLDIIKKKRSKRTERPIKIEPSLSETMQRSLPNDQILIKPTRRLTQRDTPKSVQAQLDTHAAIKQIATIENRRIYEVLNEIVEKYIQQMPNQSKKLVIDSVRTVQKNMPDL